MTPTERDARGWSNVDLVSRMLTRMRPDDMVGILQSECLRRMGLVWDMKPIERELLNSEAQLLLAIANGSGPVDSGAWASSSLHEAGLTENRKLTDRGREVLRTFAQTREVWEVKP